MNALNMTLKYQYHGSKKRTISAVQYSTPSLTTRNGTQEIKEIKACMDQLTI